MRVGPISHTYIGPACACLCGPSGPRQWYENAPRGIKILMCNNSDAWSEEEHVIMSTCSAAEHAWGAFTAISLPHLVAIESRCCSSSTRKAFQSTKSRRTRIVRRRALEQRQQGACKQTPRPQNLPSSEASRLHWPQVLGVPLVPRSLVCKKKLLFQGVTVASP